MEGGPPIFSPGFTRPNLLYGLPNSRLQDFHLLRCAIPSASLADWFVRFRSPLLTESLLLSFPPPTEMFQFSGFASFTYSFSKRYPCGWVAPFGDLRINTWLPVPLSFSQAPASFIASRRQDIRHVPLLSVTSTIRRDRFQSFDLWQPRHRMTISIDDFSRIVAKPRVSLRFDLAFASPPLRSSRGE